MKTLTRSDLEKVDLEKLRPYASGPNSNEFFKQGEHYRLLALLSTFVREGIPIIDIGTCYGDSALALSYGGTSVHSFDVVNMVGDRELPDTIHLNLADLFDPVVREQWRPLLLRSGLILIDIAPHSGEPELELVEWLQRQGYDGFIVLDDIWWYKGMRDNLWYRIKPEHRLDATSLGHWSGTGIVSFGKAIAIEHEPDNSDWTLVTAYFDLTKRPDASDALKARPAEWYLEEHGTSILSLDKNLVVFCDPEFEQKIWEKRPSWLHERTRVIPMTLEEFPLTQYRDRIIANRGGATTCPSDPRATASYYLFCMARYAMMKQAVGHNSFDSSHFAWIDMGIERMGFQNLIHLDEALGQHRDRFSVCWIDYQPRQLVENLPEYFDGCVGRCSFSSGFFTGDAEHMWAFCDEIEKEFLVCLEAGFGHADEQLYPRIFFRRPELFDWYCGDYTEIITNYSRVRERPVAPLRNLIRSSFAAGDLDVCRAACDDVIAGIESGACALEEENRVELYHTREVCR